MVSKFDSLFTFLQMLNKNLKKDKLSILSKETIQAITPYLLKQKTANICKLASRIPPVTNGNDQTKHNFHGHKASTKLTAKKKYIPAHMAQTQLGLDFVSSVKNALAFVVQPVESQKSCQVSMRVKFNIKFKIYLGFYSLS